MARLNGTEEVRKLQATGGSTFTMSIPKAWVIQHGLSARDSLKVDWRPSGALRITPLNQSIQPTLKSIFNFESLPENSLHDHLMGAYIAGADTIRIDCKSEHVKTMKLQLRRFLRSTRGFEIIEEKDTGVLLRCLINSGDLPLHSSLNRMYLLLSSLVRDFVDVFESGDVTFVSDVAERESEVDALLYLIERQIRAMLHSVEVASRLNVERAVGLEYANLAKSLERMMDHAQTMVQFYLNEKVKNKKLLEPLFVDLIPKWQVSLKELMINIRTRDSERIEVARTTLKQLQIGVDEFRQVCLTKNIQRSELVLVLQLGDSIRRMCAYGRDFGETLLNLKVGADLVRKS